MNTNENYAYLKRLTRAGKLHTVCEEARCPNIHECWGRHRTATFMLLGKTCTRRCGFCAVTCGKPGALDLAEPDRIAQAVRQMELRHAVLTMVTRDDLADGGASVVARTVQALRSAAGGCTLEVLCSDFKGSSASVAAVVQSQPDIASHNLETVRRLARAVKPGSTYARSLGFLTIVKRLDPAMITKSSLMLGLGETEAEVLEAMDDLRAADVDIINLGQYLRPHRRCLAVQKYWTLEEFARLRGIALNKGFAHCESGPLVRSSYHAEHQLGMYRDNA